MRRGEKEVEEKKEEEKGKERRRGEDGFRQVFELGREEERRRQGTCVVERGR